MRILYQCSRCHTICQLYTGQLAGFATNRQFLEAILEAETSHYCTIPSEAPRLLSKAS